MFALWVCRREETAELVRSLAMDNVILERPACAEDHKLTKGDALNVALRRLYPSSAAIPVTDVVAVLDGDQVCSCKLLVPMLPFNPLVNSVEGPYSIQ